MRCPIEKFSFEFNFHVQIYQARFKYSSKLEVFVYIKHIQFKPSRIHFSIQTLFDGKGIRRDRSVEIIIKSATSWYSTQQWQKSNIVCKSCTWFIDRVGPFDTSVTCSSNDSIVRCIPATAMNLHAYSKIVSRNVSVHNERDMRAVSIL